MLIVLTIILIISLSLAIYPTFSKHLKIVYFKKKYNLNQHERYFDAHYQLINGFTISKKAREKQDDVALVYGEIDFVSFIALISCCQPGKQTVFYDLGSGTGKPTIATAMVFPVKKSCGIEILPALHTAAESRRQQLLSEPLYQQSMQAVSFLNNDFMSVSLEDASLIFINATAFIGDTWDTLRTKLAALKQPLTIVTTTKPLNAPGFIVIKTTMVTMSWGPVRAFIQHKPSLPVGD